MTRPVDKPKRFRSLFPDGAALLERAGRVATEVVRRCEICDSPEAELARQVWIDGYVCVDSQGCGRRQNKTRRIR